MLSAINISEENYREALASLEKAHKLDPDDTEVIFQTASIHYRLGDARHIPEFDRLFDLGEEETDLPQKMTVPSDSARPHFHAKNYAAAINLRALPREREPRTDHRAQGSHLGDTRNHPALERLSPGGDEDRYILCLLYAKTGRGDRARSILSGLASSETYRTKARKEPALARILAQIEEEAKAKSGEIRN